MRTLLYVPVIHSSADLGSIAKAAEQRGVKGLGQELWDKHRATVDGFWDALLTYFDSIDVQGMKIYQDGMVADGDVGKKLAEETAKAGSKNYQLILRLLERGAVLVQTEDFKLVKKEYDQLHAIAQAQSLSRKIIAFIRYKMVKTRLLYERDAFIADKIDQTLKNGETAILFIGAFHHTKKRLPGNIRINEIKDTAKVMQYQRLLPFYHRYSGQFNELGRYLVTEIPL